MNYGCIRFVDSYRLLSSGLDSLVKTIVDNINKTLKNLKEKYVDNDHIFNTVTDLEEYNRTIEDLKKDYPDKIIELEEALLEYMGENDLKNLKTGFPDKWNYLTKKLAYPYEYFNGIDENKKNLFYILYLRNQFKEKRLLQ